ncbi:hypothetical protein [Halioxenophilus aromaticivorans]|uniref:Chromosome partition protein Smc n=1 Tax=Halioxenophilus aromaticivorans TaxID=1306992 RepID=A0AAV3TYZ8_9ALTE
MVQSRREPTISSSDFSAPLDDDTPNRNSNGRRTQKTPPPPPTPAKGGQGMAIFAFLIALVGVGAGGFAVWKIQALTQELTGADDRIAALEKRLTLSDDESSQSVTVLQANLKQAVKDIGTNESEIRKLWDTRNVNRKAIAQNDDGLKAAQAELEKSVASVQKALSDQYAGLAGSVKELEASSGSLERQVANLRTQLAELDGVAQKLAAVDQLSGRVRSNEEAIEAIDAYRLNINRQLVELQQKLSPGP